MPRGNRCSAWLIRVVASNTTSSNPGPPRMVPETAVVEVCAGGRAPAVARRCPQAVSPLRIPARRRDSVGRSRFRALKSLDVVIEVKLGHIRERRALQDLVGVVAAETLHVIVDP